MKLNKPFLNSTVFNCHPSALDAYMHLKNIDFQYTQKLPVSFISETQALNPLHAIKVNRNHFEFFGGWLWLSSCRKQQLKQINVIVHKELTNEKINELSWLYVLSLHLKSIHRSTNLAQLKELLDTIPIHFRKKIFGEFYTLSTDVNVTNLSHESRESIRNQTRKSINKKLPIPKGPILHRLSKE